jgi:hypothetical protein
LVLSKRIWYGIEGAGWAQVGGEVLVVPRELMELGAFGLDT